MIGLTFSWGLNGVAAKLANTGYDPIFVSIARSAIGGALVLVWCMLRGIRLFDRDGTLFAGVVAGLLFGGEFVLIFIGLEYTTVARSSLLVNSMPFWVLIGAHFLLGEHMSARKWAGLVLAFAGVVLVFSDKLSLPSPDAITGDILSLGAGILWALTTLVIKRSKLASAKPEKVLLYQLAVSAAATMPLLGIAGPAIRDANLVATGALMFQAVYVVAFTYVVWFWLMARYPAAGLSSFAFLTPAFGVLCGGVILGEPLSWRIFAALALIAAGLIIVNRPSRAPTH
ncbi:DMT family transporter [Arvimicrobium flavum]|uniref:DMT family transporter n=1 Tax=Arvimicrobium flavum TaxID=3393320 RepID=UPI00398D2043